MIVGVLTLFAFRYATDRVVKDFGVNFVKNQALLEKNKSLSLIRTEVALSLKLVDSPLLKEWAQNETDDRLKTLALQELDSYRKSFRDKSVFLVIDQSKHYYFNNATGEFKNKELRYTLNPASPDDQWYFRTIRSVDTFALNVDYDSHLNVTKVWVNTILKGPGNRKLGLAGTGFELTDFINTLVHSKEEGVSTILVDKDGNIEGHKDPKYMEHNSRIRGQMKKITVFDLMPKPSDQSSLKNSLSLLTDDRTEAQTLLVDVSGHDYLAGVSYISDIGWYDIVLADISKVVNIRNFIPIIVVISLSLLAFLTMIGILIHKIILRPLHSLTSSSQQIARGQYDVLLPIQNQDELGQLTQTFNRMASTIKDHTENLEQKVEQRTQELSVANTKLAESNKQVMDSIHYAKLIQSSILPTNTLMENFLSEHFVIYRPRDIVGGDFYYFREVGSNCLIAVADCTGHGVPGAFMTMTANSVLNHITHSICADQPAVILKELNRIMRETLQQNSIQTATDNGLDIAICYCSANSDQILFAGAKMSLYHLVEGDVVEVKGDRQAIGYASCNLDFDYALHAVPINGLAFYLVTDGFLDQGGDKGVAFGRDRFKALIKSVAEIPLSQQKAIFEEELEKFQGTNRQRDDITLFAFRALTNNHSQEAWSNEKSRFV